MIGHGRAPEIGFSGYHEIRAGGVVGWWRRESPASVSREMLLAGLGSLIGGSFCVALGTFFLLFQHL
jgi:hypothetical protein